MSLANPTGGTYPGSARRPATELKSPPDNRNNNFPADFSTGPATNGAIVLRASDNPRFVSLASAIVAAKKYATPNMLAAAAYRSSQATFRASWGYFLPKLGIAAGLTRNFPEVEFDAFALLGDKNTAVPAKTILTPKLLGSATFSASIPLIDPSAIAASMGAHDVLRAQSLNKKNTEDLTNIQVISFYLQAHLAKQNLEMVRKQLKRTLDHRDSVKDRVKGGVVRILELDRAELEVLRAKDTLSKAEEGFRQSIGALGILIGEAEEFFISPPKLQPVLSDIPSTLITDALKGRPDYKAAELELESSRDSRMQGYLNYLPKLSFSASANYNSNAAGLNPNNWTGAIGLSATWNIYDGGVREAGIAQSAAVIDQNRIKLENLRDTIKGAINAQHLNYQVARESLKTVELEKTLAKSLQIETTKQFLAGTKTSLDVIDANLNLFRVEISLDSAQVQADLSYLNLMHASGRLDEVVRHLLEKPPTL